MKKVLIVSPYFAPENSVASIRFTKIGKYLQELGYDVTIICTQMNVKVPIDRTLERDLNLFKNVIRINYPEFLYYKVKALLGVEKSANSVQAESKQISKSHEKNTELLVWGYVHICSVILGWKYIDYIRKHRQTYDVVISTYSPISPHILGNYMKKRKLCTTWIADFRDPMTALYPKSFMSKCICRQGSRLVRKADYITVVSKGNKKKIGAELGKYCKSIKDKIRIINNGYDDADREYLRDIQNEKGKLVFAYCGTIYSIGGEIQTDISPLFRAISMLTTENKIDRDKVEVRYAGRNIDLFKKLASKYNMESVVRYYGKISRDESLALQRKSDVIIVSVWNNKGDGGVLTGKFFETLLVQRNVLGLVSGNEGGSELTSIINDLRCGFAYEEINGDSKEISQLEEWILKIYTEKMKFGEVSYHNIAKKEPYSHRELAKKFEMLF